MASKVILICPGGRENILSVQLINIMKLLDLDIIFEYHIWNFSWNINDSDYISNLNTIHDKIKIKYSPYNNASRAGDVASKQFAYLLCDYYNYDTYKDYIFVKLDDDICFIDTTQFEEFINARKISNSFLYSANVINNNYLNGNEFHLIHNNFLNNYPEILKKNSEKSIETFINDKRLSINFVSFLGSDLKYINEEFSNGIGSNDEWRLCHDIAKHINKQNEICLFMTVVHYSYGGYIDPIYIHNYESISRNFI
jgi:hypothetical protein